MLLRGDDRLAGWAIWFFVFSILHAAALVPVRGAFVLEMVVAALLVSHLARVIPADDDGRRLPPSASAAIIMIGFVILASVALGNALSRRAGVVQGG